MDSYNKCIQAIAQNATSLGTNLVSHELNMNTACKIQNTIDNAEIGHAIVTVSGAISPRSIISTAVTGDPNAINKDLQLWDRKEDFGFLRDRR